MPGQKRGPIDDMHMKMRFGRAAGIADVTDHPPGLYAVAHFDLEQARSHVGVEYVATAADIHHNMISTCIEEVEINCIFSRVRYILGNAVDRFDHGTIGDG